MSDQPLNPPAPETPAPAPAIPPAPAPRGRAFSLWNVLAVSAVPVVLILGVAGAFYFGVKPPPPEAGYSSHVRLAELRLGDPTRMDPRYADADGDLIADPPAKRRNPKTVVFSGIARFDPTKEKEAWASFLPHLEKVCKRKVEYYPATSASDQFEALREGRIDICFLGTGAVPVAVNTAGFVPAYSMATPEGKHTYKMMLVVPADSPIKDVKGLKGTTIAYTSLSSLSGFKAPLVLLRDEYGLMPGRDYQYLMVGDHRVSIKGVATGLYQAASVAGDYFTQEKAAGRVKDEDVRVLYEGPPEPVECVGLAHDLPDGLAKDIRKAFETFEWKGSSLLGIYGANGYAKFVTVDYKEASAHPREIDKKIMAWDD